MRKSGLTIILAAVCAGAPAHANDTVEVEGTFGGFALGAGTLRCSGCPSMNGEAVDFRLGHAYSNKLGWVFDFSGVAHRENEVDTFSGLFGLLVQYWPASRLWLAAGPGIGRTDVDTPTSNTTGDFKFAIIGAAGVELLQRRKFVLDLRARYGSYDAETGRLHNVSLLLGFTWY